MMARRFTWKLDSCSWQAQIYARDPCATNRQAHHGTLDLKTALIGHLHVAIHQKVQSNTLHAFDSATSAC